MKKRNELAIFEELKLKPPTTTDARTPEHYPKEYSLHKLNVLCVVDKNNKPISWWKKKHGKIFQVDVYGKPILSGDKHYEKKIPKESSLKKNKSKILVTVSKYNMIASYWVKDKNGELIQVNLKEKQDIGIEFTIKSWLRDKAIGAVSLEINSMKKKAYEYSKDELMRMIKEEENKIIKKGGWKSVKIAALSTLGLSWLPFI